MSLGRHCEQWTQLITEEGSTLIHIRTSVLRVKSQINQPERILGVVAKARDRETDLLTTHHDRPRDSSPINDNYCLNVLKAGLLPGANRL